MRRLLFAIVLPAALLVARSAQAQNMKIGYVDVQRAIQEVEEGKAARTRLKSELDARRAQMAKKQTELEKMKADYDKQSPVLSDEAKKKKQEELQKAFLEAQNSAQEMQEELTGKEQEAMQGISKRMLQIVADVSEREGVTYVLDKAILLHAPAANDLTNEVVRLYNDKHGNAAAPAGKTPEKKAPSPAPKK